MKKSKNGLVTRGSNAKSISITTKPETVMEISFLLPHQGICKFWRYGLSSATILDLDFVTIHWIYEFSESNLEKTKLNYLFQEHHTTSISFLQMTPQFNFFRADIQIDL